MLEQSVEKYRKIQVETASPGQLVVMMYEGVARFLTRAAGLMEQAKYKDAEYWTGRANEVVYELLGSLDLQSGGEIAASLSATYTMTIREILRAQTRHDPDVLTKLSTLYAELGRGWAQIASARAV